MKVVLPLARLQQGMFYSSAFNGNISTWNTGSVIDMGNMFSYAPNFNQDISVWDVGNLESMEGMFEGASSFGQNLCSWGLQLGTEVRVFGSFDGTNCPNQEDPEMNGSPPGPFCFAC